VSDYPDPGTEKIWQSPKLRDDEPDRRHTVGWVELFFDLIFVVVIAVLANNLADHEDLVQFAIQFTAIFWVWNGFVYYTERFESHGLDNRLFTFVAIVAAAGLAIWGHNGLTSNYLLFAGSYVFARLLNIGMWLRAGYREPRFRRAALGFTGGFICAFALLTTSLFVPFTWRVTLFAAAAILEIFTPAITGRFQAGLPLLTRDKFPERFGLLTLIVLGETVTQVILSVAAHNTVSTLSVPTIGLAVMGLAVGFGLWWVYFDFVARRPTSQVLLVVLGWIYLHLLMLIGIVVIGVALSEALAAPVARPMPVEARYFLLVGLGVVLVAIGLLEVTLAREPLEPTGAIVSTVMKISIGVVVAGLSLLPLNAFGAFAIAIVGLGIQATYGAWAYYIKARR
jgi:low temperature requirement protein LtrA